MEPQGVREEPTGPPGGSVIIACAPQRRGRPAWGNPLPSRIRKPSKRLVLTLQV